MLWIMNQIQLIWFFFFILESQTLQRANKFTHTQSLHNTESNRIELDFFHTFSLSNIFCQPLNQLACSLCLPVYFYVTLTHKRRHTHTQIYNSLINHVQIDEQKPIYIFD